MSAVALFEEIDEPIEVLVKFQGGGMKPLRFRWKARTYDVVQVTGRWTTHVGQFKQYYFSVLAGTRDYFEIFLDSRTLLWRLARVCLEG